MARKIGVEIVGDSRQYERALQRSARSTQKFSREIGKMGRGAAAGSGVFRGLGRSIAFASGGFLAFASVTDFLRNSVDAAREAEVAQRALGAQMKASGQLFRNYRGEIEQTTKGGARFGFQNEQVAASLTVLDRGTGNISQALKLQGLAYDLARAKGIDLAAAAQTIAKVFGGQETALRRAVPGLRKNAHGIDLIREAQQKLAGQALANTTSSERFNAQLHDTQEIIGGALLPILNKYLDAASRWLSVPANQAKIQKDVNKSASVGSQVLGGLTDVLKGGADAWTLYNRAVDKVSSKRVAGPLGLPLKVLLKPFAGFGGALAVLDKLTAKADRAHKALANLGRPAAALGAGIPGFGLEDQKTPAQPAERSPAAMRRLAALRNQWFDARIGRMISRSQYAGLQQQIRLLQQAAVLIRQRIAVTKDITRRLQLEDQLVELSAQTGELRKQVVQNYIDRLQFNVEKTALTANLRDDLQALRRLEAYLKQRVKTSKGNLDFERQLLDVQLQIADVVKQRAENARKTRAKREGADQTLFHKANPLDLIRAAGLNLSAAQLKRLRAVLSTLGPGGAVPARSRQFGGAGAGFTVHIQHFHSGARNAKELEADLLRRNKQRAHARRGA